MPEKQRQTGGRPFKEEIAEVLMKGGIVAGLITVGAAYFYISSLPDTVQILSPGCLNSLCIGALALAAFGGGMYLKRRIPRNLQKDQTPSDIVSDKVFFSDNNK